MVEIRYVKLCLNSELKTFSKYEESYELELINVNTTRMKKVKASEIILAMPKRSLELLDQDNFFFKDASHSKVRKLIRKPYECENIYIVGEAYSSDQGGQKELSKQQKECYKNILD